MSISPENGSILIGGKRIAADEAIGVTVAAVLPALVIVTFAVEVDE
jgi:hypothetical protein